MGFLSFLIEQIYVLVSQYLTSTYINGLEIYDLINSTVTSPECKSIGADNL